MKLGIVGSGKIVQEFLPWLASSPAFEVAALCSTQRSAGKAAALCAQYGVPFHVTDYSQLLAAVDVVYIALPNLLHTAYAKAALEAGRHGTKVHLDRQGSFIWPLIDGKRTVADIAALVKEEFGEAAEPLYPRIVKYFQIVESYRFVKFVNMPKK